VYRMIHNKISSLKTIQKHEGSGNTNTSSERVLVERHIMQYMHKKEYNDGSETDATDFDKLFQRWGDSVRYQ